MWDTRYFYAPMYVNERFLEGRNVLNFDGSRRCPIRPPPPPPPTHAPTMRFFGKNAKYKVDFSLAFSLHTGNPGSAIPRHERSSVKRVFPLLVLDLARLDELDQLTVHRWVKK